MSGAERQLRVESRITSLALICPLDGNRDPWHGMVGDAHPLDFVEGQLSDIVIWHASQRPK
jgi:hypothetical protein